MDVKVLGSGCAKCQRTVALIEEVAHARAVPLQVDKVQDMRAIASYGVMSTPAVVVDGKVVHAGGVPGRDKIESWFAPRP